MSRACVQDHCGLCNRELGAEDQVILLERADLTGTPPAGSKALKEGSIRVGKRTGKKLAWCSDCGEKVFGQVYDPASYWAGLSTEGL